MGVKDDCIRVVKTAVEVLGGLAVIVSNAVELTTTSFEAYSNGANKD